MLIGYKLARRSGLTRKDFLRRLRPVNPLRIRRLQFIVVEMDGLGSLRASKIATEKSVLTP
jgi:hypothetical protein